MLISSVLRILRSCSSRALSAQLLLLFFLVGLSGCQSLKSVVESGSSCAVPAGGGDTSRISFFLNLERTDGPHVNLQLISVEILGNGLWIPVTTRPRELDTKKIWGRQLLLANLPLPPGDYEKIKLTFAPGANLIWNEQTTVLPLQESVVELLFPKDFSLQSRASEAVFLAWDVDASFTDVAPASLVFRLGTAKSSPITANQLYVACPDVNTVYSVRTDKKWVDKSFFVAGRPTYIAIDDIGQKLFVLCQEDGDIKIIDLVTNSVTDVIGLPMTFRPNFMWVDADVAKAYVLDDLGYISLVDLRTGHVIARKKIGQRPSYVIGIPNTRSVAVSSAMNSKVYLLDDQTLAIKDQISVGSSPAGILQKDNYIYIAEQVSDSVTVYDCKLRQKVNSLPVGYLPNRLVALDQQIYVANRGSGSISVVSSAHNRVFREIPIGNQIYEMVVSAEDQLLYVGKNRDEDCGGSVTVLDITASKVIGEIQLGSRPMGMAIGR